MATIERKATEHLSVEEVLAKLEVDIRHTEIKFRRLKQHIHIPDEATVLDIGAAQGRFIMACQKLGYEAYGVEPSDVALETATALAEQLDITLPIRKGFAESIPYENDMFDVVHAGSVMEHVLNLEASLAEIYRVLKPGGVFWFNSASAMSPFQGEISKFPLFGWYPNALKLKIMYWARDHKPELIGGTPAPAIHWFTPRKARRVLREAGFSTVYDRWDLRHPDEGGDRYRMALRMIRASPLTKFVADVAVGGCSFAAVK